jgi:hypothetical protein
LNNIVDRTTLIEIERRSKDITVAILR